MDFKSFAYLAVHLMMVILIYFIYSYYNVFLKLPNNENLMQFDAQLYHEIGSRGYKFIPNKPSNLAFFPLFPYLWNLLKATPVVVSLINIILFAFSFSLLDHQEYNFNISKTLSILSLPSFIFFAVPYSESLFFCFGCAIIVGYRINSEWLKYLGFFGASLTRSVSVIFIPAIIVCEIFNKRGLPRSVGILNAMKLILVNITALLVVAYVQYYQTGKWLYFIEVQQFWHRKLSLIKLPITTMSENRLMALDSLALVFGTVACIYLLIYFRSIQTRFKFFEIDNAVLFSILYIAAITVIDLLFTSNTGGTNIWSLNRHLIATPFFITFYYWLTKRANLFPREFVALFCIIIIVPFLTNLRNYPTTLMLQYGVSIFALISGTMKLNLGFITLYLISTAIQLYFFYGFISGQFLG